MTSTNKTLLLRFPDQFSLLEKTLLFAFLHWDRSCGWWTWRCFPCSTHQWSTLRRGPWSRNVARHRWHIFALFFEIAADPTLRQHTPSRRCHWKKNYFHFRHTVTIWKPDQSEYQTFMSPVLKWLNHSKFQFMTNLRYFGLIFEQPFEYQTSVWYSDEK